MTSYASNNINKNDPNQLKQFLSFGAVRKIVHKIEEARKNWGKLQENPHRSLGKPFLKTHRDICKLGLNLCQEHSKLLSLGLLKLIDSKKNDCQVHIEAVVQHCEAHFDKKLQDLNELFSKFSQESKSQYSGDLWIRKYGQVTVKNSKQKEILKLAQTRELVGQKLSLMRIRQQALIYLGQRPPPLNEWRYTSELTSLGMKIQQLDEQLDPTFPSYWN